MGSTAGTSCLLSTLSAFLLLSMATATTTIINSHDIPPVNVSVVVNPFCKNATTTPDRKFICTRLVNGATTWPEAMTNAIKSVIVIANIAKPKVVDCVEVNLPSRLNPQTRKSISWGCRDSFETYVDNLEKCIEFVKHDPQSSLGMYLSGNTFYNCKDGLAEFQLSFPEVNYFYRQTMKLADILVAIFKAKPKEM